MEVVLSSVFLKRGDRQAAWKNVSKGGEEREGIALFSNEFQRVRDLEEEYQASHWPAQVLALADNCWGQNPITLAYPYCHKDTDACTLAGEDSLPDGNAGQAMSHQRLIKGAEQSIQQILGPENPELEGPRLHLWATDVASNPQTANLSNASGHNGRNDNDDGAQAVIIDENGCTDAIYTAKALVGSREVKARLVEIVNKEGQARNNPDLGAMENSTGMAQEKEADNHIAGEPSTKTGHDYTDTNARENSEGDENVKFGPTIMNMGEFDTKTSFEGKMLNEQWNTKGNYDRNILEQISSAVIKHRGADKSWELLLKLEPESLGKVMVKLTLKGDSMVAKFLTSSQETREIIEMNCQQLEHALNSQGFNISRVEVSGTDYEPNSLLGNPYDGGNQWSNDKGHSSKGRRRQGLGYGGEDTEMAITPYDPMEESSVNYFA